MPQVEVEGNIELCVSSLYNFDVTQNIAIDETISWFRNDVESTIVPFVSREERVVEWVCVQWLKCLYNFYDKYHKLFTIRKSILV